MANPVSWLVVVGVGVVSLAIAIVLLFLRRGASRVGVLPVVFACALAAPLVAAAFKMSWMEGDSLLSGSDVEVVRLCVNLGLVSAAAWVFAVLTLAATVLGLALSLWAKPAEERQAGPVRATLLVLLALLVLAAPLPLLVYDARVVGMFTRGLTMPLESAGEAFDFGETAGLPAFFAPRVLVVIVVVFAILFLVLAALTAVVSWRRRYARAVSAVGLGLAAFVTLVSGLWLCRLGWGVMTVRNNLPRTWVATLTTVQHTGNNERVARVVGEVATACEKGSASACALADKAILLVDVDAGFALRRTPFPDAAALQLRLREELEGRDGRAVFVRGRRDLEYGRVAKAVSAGCEAGADEIGLLEVAASPASREEQALTLACFVPPPEERSLVVLRMADEGWMTVNLVPLGSLEDAEARLRDIFMARSDKTLFVGVSDATPYGRALEVMAVARRAGVERLAPEPDRGGVAFAPEKRVPEAGGVISGGKGSGFVAPIEVPDEIPPEETADLGIEGGVPGGVEGGVAGGVVGGVVGGLPGSAPAVSPVRVGGQIKEPKKLKHVDPAYPPIARQARVQGVVILECTLSPQGRVVEVKVVRSIPLLDAAAVEAVRQWVYAPTLLNGVPVPVIMIVTVNFRIS